MIVAPKTPYATAAEGTVIMVDENAILLPSKVMNRCDSGDACHKVIQLAQAARLVLRANLLAATLDMGHRRVGGWWLEKDTD